MLSLTKLSQRLLEDNTDFLLVRYINDVQGFELARLDFDRAAKKIHISARTVGRAVKRLAEKNVLFVEGDKLRINRDLEKVG